MNDSPVDCQSRDRIARRQLSAQLTEGLSYLKNYTPPVCFAASSLRRLRFAFPLRGGLDILRKNRAAFLCSFPKKSHHIRLFLDGIKFVL